MLILSSRLAKDYEEPEQLGKGTYGIVYKMKRKKDGAKVVVKHICFNESTEKEDLEAAIREAEMMKALDHFHIVKYIDHFLEGKSLYLVMEYASNGDLADVMRKRGKHPFSEEEIWTYFVQIAQGLRYLHDRKVLHRDIKPQNIFIDGEGNVKIGDFGMVKALSSANHLAYSMVGTPLYLAPEICRNGPYDSKADIWSLGCVLYELAGRSPPFNGPKLDTLYKSIVSDNPLPLSSRYSQEFRELVSRMLSKDPARRPSINQILRLPACRIFIERAVARRNERDLQSKYEKRERALRRRLDLEMEESRKILEELQAAKREVDIRKEKTEQLATEHDKAVRLIGALEGQLETLQNKLHSLEQQSQSASEAMSRSLQEREMSCESKDHQLREQEESLRQRLEACVAKEKEIESGREELLKERNSAQEAAKRLATKEAQLTEREANIDQESRRLNERATELSEAESRLENRFSELEKARVELSRRLHAVEDAESKLQDNLMQARQEIDEREKAVATAEQTIQEKQGELANREQTLRARENERIAQERETKEKNAQLEAKEERLALKENELSQLADALSVREEKIMALQGEIAIESEALDSREVAMWKELGDRELVLQAREKAVGHKESAALNASPPSSPVEKRLVSVTVQTEEDDKKESECQTVGYSAVDASEAAANPYRDSSFMQGLLTPLDSPAASVSEQSAEAGKGSYTEEDDDLSTLEISVDEIIDLTTSCRVDKQTDSRKESTAERVGGEEEQRAAMKRSNAEIIALQQYGHSKDGNITTAEYATAFKGYPSPNMTAMSQETTINGGSVTPVAGHGEFLSPVTSATPKSGQAVFTDGRSRAKSDDADSMTASFLASAATPSFISSAVATPILAAPNTVARLPSRESEKAERRTKSPARAIPMATSWLSESPSSKRLDRVEKQRRREEVMRRETEEHYHLPPRPTTAPTAGDRSHHKPLSQPKSVFAAAAAVFPQTPLAVVPQKEAPTADDQAERDSPMPRRNLFGGAPSPSFRERTPSRMEADLEEGSDVDKSASAEDDSLFVVKRSPLKPSSGAKRRVSHGVSFLREGEHHRTASAESGGDEEGERSGERMVQTEGRKERRRTAQQSHSAPVATPSKGRSPARTGFGPARRVPTPRKEPVRSRRSSSHGSAHRAGPATTPSKEGDSERPKSAKEDDSDSAVSTPAGPSSRHSHSHSHSQKEERAVKVDESLDDEPNDIIDGPLSSEELAAIILRLQTEHNVHPTPTKGGGNKTRVTAKGLYR